jgi:hypothetical protein
MSRPFNKVFCLGLSRTGTTSLCSALEVFGLRTVHYPIHLFTQSEALGLPSFRQALKLGPYGAWLRGKELKASRVGHKARQILDTHDAFGDLPVPLYYRELDSMYPGSVFIHTMRDVNSWVNSMEWLFKDGRVLWKRGHIDDELHQRVYGTTRFDPGILRKAFDQHEDKVKAFLESKGANGLVLRVDQGEMTYEKLSEFLGLPVSKSGPVVKLNEARVVSGGQKLGFIGAQFLLPLRLALRAARSVNSRG